jgi:hypothetical protein
VISFKQQLNQNRLAKPSTLLAAERIQKFYMPISCQYLPLAIYCNLVKYGLPITTILDVFRSVLDSSNTKAEPSPTLP